jgi:hypothetical protein
MTIRVVLIKSDGRTNTIETERMERAVKWAASAIDEAEYEWRHNLGRQVEAVYMSIDGSLRRYTLDDIAGAVRDYGVQNMERPARRQSERRAQQRRFRS